MKELRIPHAAIQDHRTIREAMERQFQAAGLDLHRHDVERLEDDFQTGKRIIQVKRRTYFIMGR